MEWLNYHHLLYFWTVARERGVLPASRKLHVTHSTVGAQVHALEEALGEKLLVRDGRRLVPTELGQIVLRYADEIFGLGREMLDTVRGRPTGRPARVSVGIVDVLPKLMVRRILQPVHTIGSEVRLVCHEDRLERLLGELVAHELDVVLSDAEPTATSHVRVYPHLLGESAVSFFASPALARKLARDFPASLDGAPVILPTDGSALRRSLDAWIAKLGVRPKVVAEIEDSALLKSFGQEGLGAFPAPTVMRTQVMRQYLARELGVAKGVKESFFAITAERRVIHPAVVALTERAKEDLFAQPRKRKPRRAPK